MGGFHFCRETVYGISLLWYQLAGLPRNSMYDGEIFDITLLNIRIKFSVHHSTLTTLLNLSTDGTCGSHLVDMSHLQVSTILRKASLELKELAKT